MFVFPSRTDTFGLVMLEALACGLPVAAYPVQGPRDVVGDRPRWRRWTRTCGRPAWRRWRRPHPRAIARRAFAEAHSWRACTLQFLRNIAVEPDED